VRPLHRLPRHASRQPPAAVAAECASCVSAEELPAPLPAGSGEAAGAFGQRRPLPRKIHRAPRPHSSSRFSRRARQRAQLRRARVLHPAPPPEAHRRGPSPHGLAQNARRPRRTIERCMKDVGYWNAGTHRVPHGRRTASSTSSDETRASRSSTASRDGHRASTSSRPRSRIAPAIASRKLSPPRAPSPATPSECRINESIPKKIHPQRRYHHA